MSFQKECEAFEDMYEDLLDEVHQSLSAMRERGMTVQNTMRHSEKESSEFFQQCERGELKGEEMKAKYKTIRKKHSKAVQDLDVNIDIATNMENKAKSYIQLLDKIIAKPKCELEALNPGITEKLERKVNEELDGGSKKIRKKSNKAQKQRKDFDDDGLGDENSPWDGFSPSSNFERSTAAYNLDGLGTYAMAATANEAINDANDGLDKYGLSRNNANPANVTVQGALQATGGRKKKKPTCTVTSACETPSTAALSPIAPLLQSFSSLNVANMLPPVGTPSQGGLGDFTDSHGLFNDLINAVDAMKATLNETISDDDHGLDKYGLSRSSANPANVTVQGALQATGGRKKKKPTCTVTSACETPSTSALSRSAPALQSFSSSNAAVMVRSLRTPSQGEVGNLPGSDDIGINSPHTSTTTMPTPGSSIANADTDSNRRYCVCDKVSYGNMIACDYKDCPKEWFHLHCVNVTRIPKRKWYCPICKITMRRERSNRKN